MLKKKLLPFTMLLCAAILSSCGKKEEEQEIHPEVDYAVEPFLKEYTPADVTGGIRRWTLTQADFLMLTMQLFRNMAFSEKSFLGFPL